MPLITSNDKLGVVCVIPDKNNKTISTEQVSLIETFASLLASAIERANAATAAEKLSVDTESEKLRNILLSSVSHDLRTPLASITGASSSIVMDGDTLPPETIRELGRSINQEASRLSRIVTNLLDVTSLESGTVRLNKQPYFIEEIIGSALLRLEHTLESHKVITRAEPDLPMVAMDGVLIEQVISNLLENVAKYTPSGSEIIVEVKKDAAQVIVMIMDNGTGIKPGDEKKIFDKFYTAGQNIAQKGTGLGLAICQGIIAAHGGMIWAENRPEGGASFNFSLPLDTSDA